MYIFQYLIAKLGVNIMKIIAYELRKIHITKYTIIIFIFLIISNILYIFYDYNSNDYKYNYFLNPNMDRNILIL